MAELQELYKLYQNLTEYEELKGYSVDYDRIYPKMIEKKISINENYCLKPLENTKNYIFNSPSFHKKCEAKEKIVKILTTILLTIILITFFALFYFSFSNLFNALSINIGDLEEYKAIIYLCSTILLFVAFFVTLGIKKDGFSYSGFKDNVKLILYFIYTIAAAIICIIKCISNWNFMQFGVLTTINGFLEIVFAIFLVPLFFIFILIIAALTVLPGLAYFFINSIFTNTIYKLIKKIILNIVKRKTLKNSALYQKAKSFHKKISKMPEKGAKEYTNKVYETNIKPINDYNKIVNDYNQKREKDIKNTISNDPILKHKDWLLWLISKNNVLHDDFKNTNHVAKVIYLLEHNVVGSITEANKYILNINYWNKVNNQFLSTLGKINRSINYQSNMLKITNQSLANLNSSITKLENVAKENQRQTNNQIKSLENNIQQLSNKIQNRKIEVKSTIDVYVNK